jgi:hypothetical protein
MSDVGLDGNVITHHSLEEVVASRKILRNPSLPLEKLLLMFDTRDTDIVDVVKKAGDAYCEVLEKALKEGRKYTRLLNGISKEREELAWLADEIKKRGDSRPVEILKEEDEKIHDMMMNVFEKARSVRL